MARSVEYPDLEFREPRSWTEGRPAPPRVVVIHTTEGHEHNQAAEDGAAYDGRRTDGTSCHYFHDPDSSIQCVLTHDMAHTARRNGNRIGIHHELCGRAGQTPAQWDDAASNAILRRAAKQAARDCRKWNIPPVRLTHAQVAAGARGICGHVDITYAFPEDHGTHTDPGRNFPWAEFIGLLRAELEADDMPTVDEILAADVDPSANRYSFGGTQWVTFTRAGTIQNELLPALLAEVRAGRADNVAAHQLTQAAIKALAADGGPDAAPILAEIEAARASLAEHYDQGAGELARQLDELRAVLSERDAEVELLRARLAAAARAEADALAAPDGS